MKADLTSKKINSSNRLKVGTKKARSLNTRKKKARK